MLKSTLQQTDPEIYNIIQEEAERQEYGIELIASENYTSKAVMEAMGSVLTNKYSEGYVGKRYYGGNEVIDKMEALGIYEVAPEDFALCEFVCSSKVEVQRIVREGLDALRAEMA